MRGIAQAASPPAGSNATSRPPGVSGSFTAISGRASRHPNPAVIQRAGLPGGQRPGSLEQLHLEVGLHIEAAEGVLQACPADPETAAALVDAVPACVGAMGRAAALAAIPPERRHGPSMVTASSQQAVRTPVLMRVREGGLTQQAVRRATRPCGGPNYGRGEFLRARRASDAFFLQRSEQ
jgi:hypothetical protein